MNNNGKINQILESKRNDVNFTTFKILSILLSNYESRMEKDPTNTTNIIYKSKKPNPDLYNQFDLNSTVRSGAKYMYNGRPFYYSTVVQMLEQLVFGVRGVIIEITTGGNNNIHRLSIPHSLMTDKLELIRALVIHVRPIIKSKRLAKNKNGGKKNKKTIILNEELIVPDTKKVIQLELEDTSEELTTVL